MTKKANSDIMDELHGEVAKQLLARIQEKDAAGTDFSNAIKFLKDNGIEADIAQNKPLASLAEQFPVFPDEDDTHTPH